ncbi:MAG: DNA-deoxyinosine glycosylase [Holosporaceae bacterium]|jgi:hypoxanthine-DNA glycosylase|nr:DNA-deoxyinosine glycosylase [Holosporaceae bacterium]
MHFSHPFNPIFDENSSVLILGTFPSVKSRANAFYYGHPQNRFWKIISHITNTNPVPKTIDDKKQMLIANRIALADVLQSCSIEGSSDNDIREAVPMNLSRILNSANLSRICANGGKAYQLFMKYFYDKNVEQNIIKLPSTSSANAKYNFEKLVLEWKKVIM